MGPPQHTPGVSGAARPRTPRFRSCGDYPSPHPGVHFWTPKSEPKNRQNQGFGFLFLIGPNQWGKYSATEFRFLSNPQRVYRRRFGCRPVKGKHVSWGACRKILLAMQPREYPSSGRIFKSPAGDSKGGQASPFVSSRKRGARGRNPIERVSPPVRPFAYFSGEGKVGRGAGAEPPQRNITACSA